MKDSRLAMNPNKLVQYLEKPPEEFTKEDLIKFIEAHNIQMVNFRFVGGDGRLKTLNFVITGRSQLDRLLSAGERVDGSSLFSYIDAASSDLYAVPRYKTAFVNPFAPIPTVDILCSYYTKDGNPLASSPENVLRKAHEVLKGSTGLTLEAMGELEYYVLSGKQDLYPTKSQKGYQESSPFCKWETLRCEAMQAIAQAGGNIKYGHSEVGYISGEEHDFEQNEIEFVPVPVEDAADQIVVARWVLRMIGYKYGVAVSFAPKIAVGHAGNGMHVHTRLTKDGKNVMVSDNGLTDIARKAVAGYLTLAPSLTAFGNTVPLS
ncbi:MAG: glutamine synthetase, partial [Chloroflexi bacterium]